MAGTPDAERADPRVQQVYTGAGTPVTGRGAHSVRDKKVLRFERVNAFYGKSHILNDATLDVREGEIVALLGRNGAGKSTLLKTLPGWCRRPRERSSSRGGGAQTICVGMPKG